MDEAVGGRKCPECRVPLPRANRCRVAELAIKHLPRPDGYTTPPPVRPDNRGDPLTPLLDGQRVRELEQELEETKARLRIAEEGWLRTYSTMKGAMAEESERAEAREKELEETTERLHIAVDGLNAAGAAALKGGRFSEAATHFTSAIKANEDDDPSNAVLFSFRSDALLVIGPYDEALADAERVTALRPEWWKGFLRKGRALCRLGRYAEATATYEAGLRAVPGNAQLTDGLTALHEVCLDS